MTMSTSSSSLFRIDEVTGIYRKAHVVACTASLIFTGHTYCLQGQRLSDVLNKGLMISQLKVAKEFLPLMNVQVIWPNEKRTHDMTTCLLAKNNILFVGERQGGLPEAYHQLSYKKVYPFRTKLPVAAKISTVKYALVSSYTLIGQLHLDEGQQLAHVLDADDNFLPMTGVEVSPELASGDSKFDFIAVNRKQLLYVEEFK